MTLPLIYCLSLVPMIGLSIVAIWSHRLWQRLAAAALAVAGMALMLGGYADLTGRPRNADLEWWGRNAEDATVLAAEIDEGRAIRLLLTLPGYDEAVWFAFPWVSAMAQQLQDAQAEAARQGHGAKLKIRRPFGEPSLDDGKPLAYAEPPMPLPPKVAADATPYVLER